MTLQQKVFYLFNDAPSNLRKKSLLLLSIVFFFTVSVWLATFYMLHNQPILLSTALLAYVFGLRHALDADHIAAIDNVTRKLMQEEKQPISLGFFFSMGHSTVVILATIVVAISTSTVMQSHFMPWLQTAKFLSTTISASFLFLIALSNLRLLISILKTMRSLRCDTALHADNKNITRMYRGFITRYFQGFFRLINKSWHMYGVGFLFGLGFDTATEIALLAITASQTMLGVSPWRILIYPVLFTAGMTLIDTLDTFLMLGAYGWAFMKPMRKLFYNLIITGISVFVALCIGSLEVCSDN